MRKLFARPRLEQMECRLVPSVVNVHASDDLQAAINHAQPGDQLVLDAGATFGAIRLPNKTGNQWITIQSSALDHLPAPGQRVGPADAPFMPKITSPGAGEPALQTAAGAHNFRFVGVEFLPATKDAFLYDLITLGDGGNTAQTSLAQVPHDLQLDQCYVHTWLDQSLKRGIALNSASTDIINSYVAGFKVDGQDAQAIAGWNGPGPFKINNNYLEGAGENVIFGGTYPAIPNLIPSDIEIRGNLISKPLAWDPLDAAAYQGKHWTVKNLLELKNAQRVTIDSNRFENNWVDAQTGSAIVLTPRGNGAAVRDVTFSNNVVVHSAQGMAILGTDDASTSQVTENILIQNNLFDDVAARTRLWGDTGGPPKIIQLLIGRGGGTRGVTIDHNTITSAAVIVIADGTHTGFVFTNNIVPEGEYGVIAHGVEGTAALQQAFPNYRFQGNTIIGATPGKYPPGNFYGTASEEHFVMQVYLDLLQRPAEPTGLATWTAALAQGVSRAQMAQAIEDSPEFRSAQVGNLYATFLHRSADPSGLNTFIAFLASGGTVEQVAEILTGSQEYFLTRGGGTNDGFLDALFRDALNRAVDTSGRATFAAALAGGATRVRVAAAVFASLEFQQGRIGTFYQRFLHRDADSSGLDTFVGFLRRGNRAQDVIAAIIGSAEYSALL
jgi:hypothetical protein